ncbi:MAG TPA: response regulator [Gammaproteobacteria bacterium]|nr:response regulator [Gammaproteobacteria bacterium]
MNDDNCESLVLIVDDRKAARYMAERTLRHAGFKTIEAASGDEALELARTMKPDVVLLDINLPDIDGYEICRRLRVDAATRSMAIIQMSATFESPEYRVRGLEGGADTFLVAPVESTVLVATVRAMLRLRQAEMRLREFDRRKDEFLATLAHELRNPLAPLLYCIDSLEQHDASPAELAHTLPIMRRQTEHLTRLVDDLIDMSRITQGKLALRRRAVTLAEIIGVAVEARQPEVDAKRQTLTVDLPSDPIELDADPVRLAQVFGNLISNAVKYSPPGGRIRIEGKTLNGSAEISVRDEGVGISPEDIGRIFDLFVQIGPPGSGLGLGLPLVSRLVAMHGGDVVASSAGIGKGSTFTVRLPLDVRRRDPIAVEQTRAPERAPAKKILVVDDNADAVDALVRLLAALKQDARAAYSGQEAIEAGREFAPDVVFMDIAMPGMTGLESIEHMRCEPWGRAAFICALSGHGQPGNVGRSMAAGADLHLVKPIGRKEIERVLARAGDSGGAAKEA